MHAHQATKPVSQWGATHPRRVAWLRVAIGIWLVCLMAILYATGHGYGWAWLLALVSALHFGLAYREFRVARQDPDLQVSFH